MHPCSVCKQYGHWIDSHKSNRTLKPNINSFDKGPNGGRNGDESQPTYGSNNDRGGTGGQSAVISFMKNVGQRFNVSLGNMSDGIVA